MEEFGNEEPIGFDEMSYYATMVGGLYDKTIADNFFVDNEFEFIKIVNSEGRKNA